MAGRRAVERFGNALVALAAAAAAVAGVWAIESSRLNEAVRTEAAFQQRYDTSVQALKRRNLYGDRVRALIDLDREVRRIAESGDVDAKTLADIANRLPRHAWLTEISNDGNGGLSLRGGAATLGALGDVVHGLMQSRALKNPTLVKAALEKVDGHNGAVAYEVRVERTQQ